MVTAIFAKVNVAPNVRFTSKETICEVKADRFNMQLLLAIITVASTRPETL